MEFTFSTADGEQGLTAWVRAIEPATAGQPVVVQPAQPLEARLESSQDTNDFLRLEQEAEDPPKQTDSGLELTALRSRMEDMGMEQEKLQHRLGQESHRVLTLQERLDEASITTERYSSEIVTLRAELAEMAEALKTKVGSDAQKSDLQAELSAARNDVTLLHQRLEDIESGKEKHPQAFKMQETHAKAMEDVDKNMVALQKQLTDSTSAAESKVAAEKQENETLIRKLAENISHEEELRGRVRSLSQQLDDSNSVKDAIDEEAQELRTQLANRDHRIEELFARQRLMAQQLDDAGETEEAVRQECNELWAKLEKSSKERDETKQRERAISKQLDESQSLRVEGDVYKAEVEKLSSEKEALADELQQVLKDKDQERKGLEEKLAATVYQGSSEMEKMASSALTLQNEVLGAQRSLIEKDQLVQTLSTELEQVYHELEDVKSKHGSAMAIMESRTNTANADCIEIRTKAAATEELLAKQVDDAEMAGFKQSRALRAELEKVCCGDTPIICPSILTSA
jgi:chromosome segregation ATPase